MSDATRDERRPVPEGKGYGQFCPLAKGAEIFAERWTPLVLRELLCGSRRFNELRKGLPRMSPSLLSRRLKELERAGVVLRREGEDGGTEYRLTEAGEELRGVVEQLGTWGKRWTRSELEREELDPGLLLWDMHRRVLRDALPDRRVTVRFDFTDVEGKMRRWWLVLDRPEVDLCLKDPGHEVDLTVTTDLATLTAVWLGDLELPAAISSRAVLLDGPTDLRRQLPGWFGLSLFAGVERKR